MKIDCPSTVIVEADNNNLYKIKVDDEINCNACSDGKKCNHVIKTCTCNNNSAYVSCKHLKQVYGKTKEKERIHNLRKSNKNRPLLSSDTVEKIKSLKNGKSFEIASSSYYKKTYTIQKINDYTYKCSCPAFKYCSRFPKTCKHIKFLSK